MSEKKPESVEHRSATWLELFFDLIFVVAIAKAAHVLQHAHDGHLGLEAYIKYILIMIPIWWAWTGCTLFSNRFDCDDNVQRLMSFAQMFAITILAAYINTDFDSYYKGFLLSYAAIRIFTVLMYLRVSFRVKEARHVSNYLALAFGVGVLISLSSLFFDGMLRYVVLYAGIGFDMIAPLIARKRLQTAPVHAHHLPERFGLLTIILLGESVLSLANSFVDLAWTTQSVLMAASSFVVACGIWWLYFNNMDRRIMNKNLGAGQSIIYSHLFIYLGLGALAAMIRFAVVPELLLLEYKLVAGFAVLSFILALQFLHVVYHPKDLRKHLLRNAGLFNIAFIMLLVFAPSVSVVMASAAALIVAYTILDHYSSTEQSVIA
jgi:low temperature requirement protein LtrA